MFMKGIKWRRPVWLIKLFHWEYWPMDLICAPVGIYWVWLGIKARSFYFLNAANPGIHTGGFVMESKNDVYGLLPEGLYPRTVPVGKKIRFEELLEQMLSKNIGFPCIAKPDIGMQGLGVKKIVSEEQLRSYHERMPLAWLVQAYVDYPNEAGIFYHRMPHEQKGRI